MFNEQGQVVFNIPVNTVSSPLKTVAFTGNGEKRFHLGNTANRKEYDEFFNNFNELNEYKIPKQSLKEYLFSVKFEYMYQTFDIYKDISLEYWGKKMGEIEQMDESFLSFNELVQIKYDNQRRYWIKLPEPFNTLLRDIAVPNITELLIESKQEEDGHFIYEFKLFLRENLSVSKRESTDGNTKSPLVVEEVVQIEGLIGENRILYGAPGTGKSYELDSRYPKHQRVTFHPEYTYHDFIGAYKPVPIYKETSTGTLSTSSGDTFDKGEPLIDYRFEPGPFTLSLEQALKNKGEMHTLIIEEINRANAASVFGDTFQLLDRDKNGNSVYKISNLQLLSYLKSNNVIDKQCDKIGIPHNFSIVATMNSADQGVFIMDSAFKRRWNFEYLPINVESAEHSNEEVFYNHKQVRWADFINFINELLADEGINEDKHIGPYFMKEGEPSDIDLVASKILIYLWDDVVRHKRDRIFKKPRTFAKLVEEYKSGEPIFKKEFPFKEETTKEMGIPKVSEDQ